MAKRALETTEESSVKRLCCNTDEEQKSNAFFLFFDTETDGNGSFRPFGQTVIQVSWTVTDRQGVPLDTFTSFVKGARVLEYNPNNWSLDLINTVGIEPMEARNKFIEVASVVNRNEGYLVAHNIQFDLDAMASLGVPRELYRNTFCTKDHTTLICCLPSKRGFKWPSQLELHHFLFPERARDAVQTHDATDDVRMLMENFLECLARAQAGDTRYEDFFVFMDK